MYKKNIISLLCIFFFLSANFVALAQDQAPPIKNKPIIVVIKSLDIVPYEQAFKSFQKELKLQEINPAYFEYILSDDSQAQDKKVLVESIKSKKSDIILTLGTAATEFAKENMQDTPTVFSMVLNPMASNLINDLDAPGGNITGVAMDIKKQEQFGILKEMLGSDFKRAVIFYNPSETQVVIDDAINAARELNINLESIPIKEEKEIFNSLKKLSSQNDVLIAIADSYVYSPQTIQYIILNTLRSGVPFVGVSPSFVKAGALLALSCDYDDMGQQAALIVLKILSGQKPGIIPISFPTKTNIAVNINTAKHINVKIPNSILDRATEIY